MAFGTKASMDAAWDARESASTARWHNVRAHSDCTNCYFGQHNYEMKCEVFCTNDNYRDFTPVDAAQDCDWFAPIDASLAD